MLVAKNKQYRPPYFLASLSGTVLKGETFTGFNRKAFFRARLVAIGESLIRETSRSQPRFSAMYALKYSRGTHSWMGNASCGVLEGREESDGKVVGHLQKSLWDWVIRREERREGEGGGGRRRLGEEVGGE